MTTSREKTSPETIDGFGMVPMVTQNHDLKIDIRYCPPGRVMEFWPDVGVHIQRALEHDGGFYSLEDVRLNLLDQKMLLWLIYLGGKLTASGVTQIAEYPQKKALLVVTLGGSDFWRWINPYIQALDQYREEIEADCLMANCRPGMAKWLNKLGWGKISTIMEKNNVQG